MTSAAVHALFPGSFDPFTLGHVDLVRRASAVFARVTVGIAHNPDKQCLFSVEERLDLVRRCTQGLDRVDACIVHGLVVHACTEIGATVIVRGVRSGTDFDFEVQMARTNQAMLASIETVLMAPLGAHAHVSSTLVRQIAKLGGDVSKFVPTEVAVALRKRFPKSASPRPR